MKKLFTLMLLSVVFSVSAQKGTFICGTDLTDTRDNQVYKTVKIGTQCWFAQNLNVGTKISGASSPSNNATIEKYCYSNNTGNCAIYGGLYEWNEMMKYSFNQPAQGICPTDWHIPSDDEWATLTDFVGDDLSAAYFLKESGTAHWDSPNTAYDNDFNALPGGIFFTNDAYQYQGFKAYFWTSSLQDITNSIYRDMTNSDIIVNRSYYPMIFGLSVRCLADKGTVGINDNNNINNSVEIYPNPAIDVVHINAGNINNNLPYQIFDCTGKQIINLELTKGDNSIDVSSLAKGIYLIKFGNENIQSQKLIIR